jgi:predicted NAD/FAD-dependent oxidoreductase
MQALLSPLLPFARLRQRMVAALTTLGACLAGAGYWLSHRAARPLQQPVTMPRMSRAAYPATAALSVARWHDLDMSIAHSWRYAPPRRNFAQHNPG